MYRECLTLVKNKLQNKKNNFIKMEYENERVLKLIFPNEVPGTKFQNILNKFY